MAFGGELTGDGWRLSPMEGWRNPLWLLVMPVDRASCRINSSAIDRRLVKCLL